MRVFSVFITDFTWISQVSSPHLRSGSHLFWISQWKQTLEEAPHGRHKGPCVGDMKCESLAALWGSSPFVPSFLSMCCWILCCNFMTDSCKFTTGWCWLEVWSGILCRWFLTKSRTAENTNVQGLKKLQKTRKCY